MSGGALSMTGRGTISTFVETSPPIGDEVETTTWYMRACRRGIKGCHAIGLCVDNNWLTLG